MTSERTRMILIMRQAIFVFIVKTSFSKMNDRVFSGKLSANFGFFAAPPLQISILWIPGQFILSDIYSLLQIVQRLSKVQAPLGQLSQRFIKHLLPRFGRLYGPQIIDLLEGQAIGFLIKLVHITRIGALGELFGAPTIQ